MRRASGFAVLVPLAVLGGARLGSGQTAAEGVEIRFEPNDAQVKGRVLPGVVVRVSRAGGGGEIASGQTGADGRWATRLAPGTYEVS